MPVFRLTITVVNSLLVHTNPNNYRFGSKKKKNNFIAKNSPNKTRMKALNMYLRKKSINNISEKLYILSNLNR